MGAAPPDLYDHARPIDPTGKRTRRSEDERVRVTDDWPEVVPVTEAEVRIVEAYFGDILDELFGPLP